MSMIPRHITPFLLAALADTPVVFLDGARQTGKSTLVRYIGQSISRAPYFTMDDLSILSAAQNDPQGFIAGLPEKVILDEIQRVPELFLAIKASVDRNRRPGRFLLTGSANVLIIPKISESLAGRMEISTLWPLSQGEINKTTETFIDALFSSAHVKNRTAVPAKSVARLLIAGGYPEILGRESLSRRQAWFKSYITTILQRDIRDLANIDALTSIPDILKIIAIRCAQPLNIADISRSLKIPQTSLKRYLALLESTFLTYRVLPWHGNLNSRLVKTPKVYMNDTGLAAHLLGIDEAGLAGNPTLTGQLFENFVASELVKQIPWSKQQPGMFHFRTHTGREVDIVLENAQGRCIGIEVKSGAHVTSHDAGGLFFLKETIGNRFYRGIILYTGAETIPFDERIHAVPISALWS